VSILKPGIRSVSRSLAILAVFASLSSDADAACTATYCHGRVKRITVNESAVLVLMDQDMSVANCTRVSDAYFSLQNDHPRIHEGTEGCHIQYVYSEW
jgi:hypothetical protein